MWTDDFYYEIKYVSDGMTNGVAYIDNSLESTDRRYSEETLFYVCKERGELVFKKSNEDTDKKEEKLTCEMCKFARREECFPRDKICPDFERAYEVSKEERKRWPEYGDATWLRMHGKNRK